MRGWDGRKGARVSESAVLCRVTPTLVDHLTQLLADAGVPVDVYPEGELVRGDVRAGDEERGTG